MAKETAVKESDELDGQVINGSEINVRVSIQKYEPDGRRYKEIPGSAIRLRFATVKAVSLFAKKLREAVTDIV